MAHEWPLVHMPGAPICWRPEVDVLLTVTGQQAPWKKQSDSTLPHPAGQLTRPRSHPPAGLTGHTRGTSRSGKAPPMWPEKAKMGFTRGLLIPEEGGQGLRGHPPLAGARSANTSTWPFSDHTPATALTQPRIIFCRVGRRGGGEQDRKHSVTMTALSSLRNHRAASYPSPEYIAPRNLVRMGLQLEDQLGLQDNSPTVVQMMAEDDEP